MIRTGMRSDIKLIRKHPKIRRILRCESLYFHHWFSYRIWHISETFFRACHLGHYWKK